MGYAEAAEVLWMLARGGEPVLVVLSGLDVSERCRSIFQTGAEACDLLAGQTEGEQQTSRSLAELRVLFASVLEYLDSRPGPSAADADMTAYVLAYRVRQALETLDWDTSRQGAESVKQYRPEQEQSSLTQLDDMRTALNTSEEG